MNEVKENFFIYTDPGRCLGCHSCELACAISHSDVDNVLSAVAKGLNLKSRNTVVSIANVVQPLQCKQCEGAPCAVACPTGTIFHMDEGFIHIVESGCIGCKLCSIACPFGAISMTDQVASKCDLCYDQMGENGKFSCACVEACPTKAISLLNNEEFAKQRRLNSGKQFAAANYFSLNK